MNPIANNITKNTIDQIIISTIPIGPSPIAFPVCPFIANVIVLSLCLTLSIQTGNKIKCVYTYGENNEMFYNYFSNNNIITYKYNTLREVVNNLPSL